jgi:hypothetical protein
LNASAIRACGSITYTSSSRARFGVAFHSFRNTNAAQALKDAPTTPAEIVEVIGYERGFTVETYVTVWLAGVAVGGPQILLRSGPITLISGSKVRVLVRPPTINDLVALRPDARNAVSAWCPHLHCRLRLQSRESSRMASAWQYSAS